MLYLLRIHKPESEAAHPTWLAPPCSRGQRQCCRTVSAAGRGQRGHCERHCWTNPALPATVPVDGDAVEVRVCRGESVQG